MAMSAVSGKANLFLRAVVATALVGSPFVALAATTHAVATTSATCTGGEEEDTFTTTCVPFLVPNSPEGFTTDAANPDVPEIDGVPCTGRDSGACIGLSQEQADMGPQPVPRSTISSSP
jgi:hypothetical protein